MSAIGTALAAALAYRCVGSKYYSGLEGPDNPGGVCTLRAGSYATLFPSQLGYLLEGTFQTGSTWLEMWGATVAGGTNAGTLNSWGLTMTTDTGEGANLFLVYSTTAGVNHTSTIGVRAKIELGSVWGMGSALQLLAKEYTLAFDDRTGKNFLEWNKATLHDTPPSIAQWVVTINQSVAPHSGVATLTFGGLYQEQDPINLSSIDLWGSYGFKGAYFATKMITLEKGRHTLNGGAAWPTIQPNDTWTGTVFLVFGGNREASDNLENIVEEEQLER